MNKNIRIAKELVRIAKSLVADESTICLALGDNGVEELDESTFRQFFASRAHSSRIANQSRTIIYVSPTVNSINMPKPGIAGIPARIKNCLSTIMNKFSHERKIFDEMKKCEYEGRGEIEDTYHLGCTIAKGRGVYSNSKNAIDSEDSYIITIYGATKDETDRLAQGLKQAFKQESVVVDYEANANADYVF